MVVIGTKPEYFEATWVKNEWSRFLRLKEKDPKKQIFFACDDVEDLPKAFARKQAQMLEDENSVKNLVSNIFAYLKKTSGAVGMADAICPFCKWKQKVNPANETAVCMRCNKKYVVSDAVTEALNQQVSKGKKVKCPHCGRMQEKNLYGCIYCHRKF